MRALADFWDELEPQHKHHGRYFVLAALFVAAIGAIVYFNSSYYVDRNQPKGAHKPTSQQQSAKPNVAKSHTNSRSTPPIPKPSSNSNATSNNNGTVGNTATAGSVASNSANSAPAPTANSAANLANTGPANLIEVFVVSTVAGTGLAYTFQLRSRKRI